MNALGWRGVYERYCAFVVTKSPFFGNWIIAKNRY